MDAARERRALALFETLVDWPADTREARLAALTTDEPTLVEAVRALIRTEGATPILQTIASDGGLPLDTPDAIPERVGAYRIVGELGRGGMGTVYLGERADGGFEQRAAIKIIRPGLFSIHAADRFAVERQVLARLHHPHIAQFLDGGLSEAGVSYIVMELLDGTPITDHADANALSVSERLALFSQACRAVEHAHRNLVVHADIKPSNVLVTPDFGIKLLDFGIARLLDGGEDIAVRGHTPGYSSPAQVAGLPTTPADDIFALGVLLRALLEGQPIDRDLDAVTSKATADDPRARYGAVSELLDDLVRWSSHFPVRARLPEPSHRLRLYWRRHTIGIAVVAGAGVLLAATAAISTTLYIRANAAQVAAEQRFEQTRGLSRYLISDVTKALAPFPGSAGIRRQIAERANATLEELSRVPHASTDLRIDSAIAYGRVGAILAAADTKDAADPRAADRAFSRAILGLSRLQAASPGRPGLSLALARARIDRAAFLAQTANDQTRAFAELDRADAVLRSLGAMHPRSIGVANARWDEALTRASVRDDQGAFAANLAALNSVVSTFPTLPLPPDAERALRLERSWSLLASAQYYLGKPREALASYRQAVVALAWSELDADARVVARRAFAAYNISSTVGELGDPRAALAAIEPGVAAVERLRNFDASPAARNAENLVRLEYAMRLADVGRFDAAIAQGQRSIAGRRELAALQPDSYYATRSVPVGLRPLGEILRQAGRRDEACATFALTDSLWSALAARRPLSAFDAGDERNVVRKALGDCGSNR